MANRIHIALSPWDLTDSYNRHSATTLASILENCSERVTVHLLYEGVLSVHKEEETQDTMEKYRELGEQYHAEIQFHDILLPDWVNDTSRESLQHFTPGTLLRLYLPEILSEDIDKIIYFDCDMVILTDIAKLWDIPIDGYSLGAVLEPGRVYSRYYYSRKLDKFGLDLRKYFNAGLLIMNLKKIRGTKNFPEMVMKMIFDHPEYKFLDQDVLNILYQKDETLFFDARFNVSVGLRMTDFSMKKKLVSENSCYTNCILHFNGVKKPWMIYSGSVDEYYWQYLRKTPWGKNSAYVNRMYADVRVTRKTILDRILSTPMNKYIRLVYSIIDKNGR